MCIRDRYHELTDAGDYYFYLADYDDYIRCNYMVDKLYSDRNEWCKKAIINIAKMGWFSSDRSINDYNTIWKLKKYPIELNNH